MIKGFKGQTVDKHSKICAFAAELLDWGSINMRDFVWRRTRDPFQILIAEILLQRTKAEQVEPVYSRLTEEYSSPEDMAKAIPEDLAKLTRSLGLAYRGPRLREIAQVIVNRYKGLVPSSEEALLQLPGVGRYVANAVLCFAFGMAVPLVDTNTLRVTSRVFSRPVTTESHKKKDSWDFMSMIMPKDNARKFNFSILDFANLICTAKNPSHEKCPISGICDFYLDPSLSSQNSNPSGKTN